MEWGKGKVQKEQKVDEAQRIAEEASKPFARRADDPELDAHFKDIDRWGDPMAGLVRVFFSSYFSSSSPASLFFCLF